MIKCLIFDCDGTLVDSEYLCNLGLELKLLEYDVQVSADELMAKYRGGRLATILHSIEHEYAIKLKKDFEIEYRILVSSLFEKELKPTLGTYSFLNSNNLPRCVASSGPIKKIKQALSITGLLHFFQDKIFSAYEINSWKPDPDLFLHTAKVMGYPPSECLVIEDSLLGIEAGKAAKMKTVLFDPSNIHKDAHNVRISDMIELTQIISKHNRS